MTHLQGPQSIAKYGVSDLGDGAIKISTLGQFRVSANSLILLVSGVILVYILATARKASSTAVEPVTFSRDAHPGGATPVALNGFGLWVAMMIALTVVNYGYPIAQLASLKEASVPVIPIGSR